MWRARGYGRAVTEPGREEHVRERDEIRAPDPPAPVQETSAAQRFASSVGNAAFSTAVARDGGGILPGGQVHPAVESTLSGTRGGGASLDRGVQERLAPALGDLSDVRVHTDDTAAALNRSVSARAFATGTDVYFGPGEYRPGSAEGDKLLAHELAHVVQQRGAPSSGPLQVSSPGDAVEREADAVAEGLQ